jgi:putative ABC transport system permease protein
MSEYRLAARLARREVRRRPGRTALVALLVAFPVAAMTCAAVLVRTEHRTPIQYWHQWNGQADLVLDGGSVMKAGARVVGAGPATERVPPAVAALVARSHSVKYQTVYGQLLRTVDQHRSRVDVSDLPMDDAVTRGIMHVTSGRAPVTPGEVFLTHAVARQLHVRLGDELRLERPTRLSLRVVGIGERADTWGSTAAVVARGTAFPWTRAAESLQRTRLVEFPSRAASQVHTLVTSGALHGNLSPAIAPRTDHVSDADANKKVRWSWVIGAVALTVVGIVITAAFAAGARRQLVTLGQLAANGAPPRTLRRTLFLQGTWTGIVGSVAGLGLAAVALTALAPHLERVLGHDVGSYQVRASDLVPIVLLGVATATIAALVPARTSTRIPVLAALSGRRPLARVPRWLPVAGALVIGGGLALLALAVVGSNNVQGNEGQVWVLTAVVGGVAVLLGACAVAPAYVSVLEPIATRLRGSSRLATRSLARQRTRTAAVVSAVAATTALAVAVSSLVLSARTHDDRQPLSMRATDVQLTSYAPPPAAPPVSVVDAIVKALPGSHPYRVRTMTSPQSAGGTIVEPPGNVNGGVAFVGTGMPVGIANTDLRTLLQLSPEDQARLDRDGALAFGVGKGRADFAVDGVLPHSVRLASADRYELGSLPRVIMTAAFAERHGYTVPADDMVVVRAPHPLTTEQRNLVLDILDEAQGGANPRDSFTGDFYQPNRQVDPLLIDEILVGVALALVLFVVAVNLALSAAETREERDVLAVVGASPATTRRTNGYKAALVTLLGTALAVPVGFLPVVVFVTTHHHHELPLVFPWRLVAALVVAVPLVAGLVTTAGSTIAVWVRPVRVSKMAFD